MKSNNFWKTYLPLVTTALFVATPGCALLLVGGGGAAGYAYAAGKHERVYPYPLPQTWEAVREAVAEMQLPVLSERSDALSAKLESQLATGEKLTITLEPKGEAITEVGIRIGTFGDATTAHLIYEKIDARLPGAFEPPKPEVHFGVSVSR